MKPLFCWNFYKDRYLLNQFKFCVIYFLYYWTHDVVSSCNSHCLSQFWFLWRGSKENTSLGGVANIQMGLLHFQWVVTYFSKNHIYLASDEGLQPSAASKMTVKMSSANFLKPVKLRAGFFVKWLIYLKFWWLVKI